MRLREELKKYVTYNEQESIDKLLMLEHLTRDNIFYREHLAAHMTASAWVVNKSRTKLLMIHHNLYNSWAWMGGHADGDEDLLKVAIKEVKEESGITTVHAITKDIFSIEILTVDGHEKKGCYVPSHLHLNVTYLLEADENEVLRIKADENSDVAWFNLEDAIVASSEPWFRTRIYSKLNEKLKNY